MLFIANVGNYHYGPGHPMRPHRIRMCHGLVMNYGLYKKMEIFVCSFCPFWTAHSAACSVLNLQQKGRWHSSTLTNMSNFSIALTQATWTLLWRSNTSVRIPPSMYSDETLIKVVSHPDNVGDDCPVFDGLFEYCSISAGGSMGMITFSNSILLLWMLSYIFRGRCSTESR